MDALPTSRKEAKRLGITKYETGKPCKRKHYSYRYTESGRCAQCVSAVAKQRWDEGHRQSKEVRNRALTKWNSGPKAQEAKRKWKEKDPKNAWSCSAVGAAKTRASAAGIKFELDKDYVNSITPDFCPVFGTPFVFVGNRVMTPESPSLDRIVPSLGYVKGNVIVISVKANAIKSAYTAKDIQKVATWLEKLEKT